MIKTFHRIISLLLAVLMLAGCVSIASAEPKKKITVMVYMCGSDLESEHGNATTDLGKMLQSRYNTDEINVVALTGGALNWQGGFSSKELTVLNVSGRRPTPVTTFYQSSMADPLTLTRFLSYCYDNFPAEQYVLVMWDHGGGPIHGMMHDQNYDDMMSMKSFVKALELSPFKNDPLDMVLLHACLMSSTEVASMVAPYAKYLVASQDSCFGFDYSWLGGMEKDPSIVATGMRIVDASFALNKSSIDTMKAEEKNSYSLIDLSKIGALEKAMDAYFPLLAKQMNDITFTRMSASRRGAIGFGETMSNNFKGYDLVDLGDLVSKNSSIAPAEANAVLNALDAAVVYNRSDDDASCTGLTVFHPLRNKDYFAGSVAIYNELGFSEGYTNYMHHFVAYLTGTSLARWTNLRTGRSSAEKAVRTLFNMDLTEEQAAHYGESRFQALLKHEDGTYTLTFVSNKTKLDGTTITGEFGGTALYAVSADGKALCAPIDYIPAADGAYIIPAELTNKSEDGATSTVYQALIRCTYDEVTQKLVPGRIYVWSEISQTYTGALNMAFDEFEAIKITFEHRQETRNDEGTLLPFEQWTVVRTEAWESAIDDSWTFALVEDTLDTNNLYAAFEIADSQSNLYTSDPLVITAERSVDGADRITYDDASLIIEEFSVTSGNDQLMMAITLKNNTGKEVFFKMDGLVVNGIAVTASAEIYGSGENWGLVKDEAQYAMVPVSLADLAGAEAVTEILFNLTCIDAATNEEVSVTPVTVVLNYDLSNAK